MTDTNDTPSEITLRVMRDRDTHDGSIYDEAKKLLARIEQLEVALAEIATLGPASPEQPCDPLAADAEGDREFNLYDQGFCEAWRRAGDVARAALAISSLTKTEAKR